MKQAALIAYLGGRKFVVALLLVASVTTLGMFGRMEGGSIGIVLGLVGAGYGFSNVANKKEMK